MKIGFVLNIFGWQIGTFDIRIDLDQTITADQPVVDRSVKRITRAWVKRMAS